MSDTPRCVCGKKRKMTQRKVLGRTCGSARCAGRNSRKHMETLRGSSHTFIHEKALIPYPENY